MEIECTISRFRYWGTVPLLEFSAEDSSDLEAEYFAVSNVSGGEIPCCEAKGDDEDWESMAFVASIW